jgi:N-acetylglucosamine-6-phosphate deacetylase
MGVAGRKGSLAPGKDADLVAFDDGVRTGLVMVGGQIRLDAIAD